MKKIYYITNPAWLTPQFHDLLLFTMAQAFVICELPYIER